MPNLNKYQLASIAAASILVSYIGASAYMVQTASVQTVQELDFPAILAADAAAVDYFLKIDGIDGESKDDRHRGWIEIDSFSWGVSQTGTFAAGGGGGAGKASFQDVHFVTKTSKASPKLFLACATGQHIKQAVLVAVRSGQEQQEFMKVTFTDLLVSSYQNGGSSGSDVVPTDQFSINFAKIEFEYKPQKPDGSLDAPVRAGYDLKANKKV